MSGATSIPGSEEASDAELVLAYRERGRDAAYGELVRRYQIRLFRLLLGLLSGGDEAEGACEDVFVQAARDIVDLEDPNRFYPWLVERAQSSVSDATLTMSHVTASTEAKDHVLTAVRAALDTLAPDERMVLILSELQRDPPESVARTLGRPIDEVKQLIETARARFVLELEQIDTLRPDDTAATAPPEVESGMTIDGRYRVGRLLGRGGHGAVFLAEHLGLKRQVALKVLRPEGALSEKVRERFRREALVLGRVDHECFVDVIDFGETPDGLLFLALEFLEGESLSGRMKRGRLEVDEALGLARDMLRGLEHIHAQGVVHRDLKPDNVILAADEDGRVIPKILDLGIAKLITADSLSMSSNPNLTRANALMGTPKYMSPEQCAGDPVDVRADLYALSVVLFEMLCGDVPFDSKYVSAVLTMHISKAPPTLAAMAMNGATPELEALVARGLAKEPADRFATAVEMREALERLMA